MASFTSYPAGTPCWVDLMSPDIEASKAFYSTVFGWAADDQADDAGDHIYTIFTLNGQNVAGVGGQPPEMAGMPPVWSSYIAVDDVAATLDKVTAAGGTVMMPAMQVMSAGEMAIFADPTGAVLSLWKAGDHIGADVCNEPNTYSWNELLSRDVATAKAFYHDVFGWTYEEQDMGPMGVYTVIAGGENGGLGGMMAMPAEMPDMVPNHWGVYFTVVDIEATIATITANGGQVVNGPMAAPGVGTFATVHDPTGGNFSVMQPESA